MMRHALGVVVFLCGLVGIAVALIVVSPLLLVALYLLGGTVPASTPAPVIEADPPSDAVPANDVLPSAERTH